MNEIDWAELRHAYGSASDVPAQLRAMVSDDPEERAAAIDASYGNIYHQGTRYSASVAAVPFIIKALEHPHGDRAKLIGLLGALAVGWPWQLGFEGFDALEELQPRFKSWDRSRFDSDEAVICRAVYVAVARGCAVYRSLLRDDDPTVRDHAAWLLAWFPAHAGDAIEELHAIARDEGVAPAVRASAVLASSHLGRDVEPWGDPLVEAAVVVARARACRDGDMSGEVVAAVNDLAERGIDSGWPDWAWGDMMEDLVAPAVAAANREVDHLLARLPIAVRNERGMGLAVFLLEAAFGSLERVMVTAARPQRVIDPAGWNDEQRRVLEALVAQEALWPAMGCRVHVALELDFDPTREEVAAALKSKNATPSAKDALRLDDERIAGLSAQLWDDDPDVRGDAARALGRGAGDRWSESTLQRLADLTIEDDDLATRTAASWALSKAGAHADCVRQRLLDAFGKGASGSDSVPYALCGMGRAVLPQVLKAIRSDDKTLVLAGKRAFPSVDSAGVDAVIEALGDAHPQVKQSAAFALQNAFDEDVPGIARAIEPLIELLDHPIEAVRERGAVGAGKGAAP